MILTPFVRPYQGGFMHLVRDTMPFSTWWCTSEKCWLAVSHLCTKWLNGWSLGMIHTLQLVYWVLSEQFFPLFRCFYYHDKASLVHSTSVTSFIYEMCVKVNNQKIVFNFHMITLHCNLEFWKHPIQTKNNLQ